MPSASTSRLRLTPFLARSVGFLPVFFPPEGRLGHAPVHRQPRPVDALPVVVGQEACLPQRQEDTLLHPELEAVVGGGAGAEAGGVEGLPLATGAQDKEDGFHADAVGSGGFAAAEGMGVDPWRDEHGHGFPEVVADAPLVLNVRTFHVGGSARLRK
jgi:hypothetical protein